MDAYTRFECNKITCACHVSCEGCGAWDNSIIYNDESAIFNRFRYKKNRFAGIGKRKGTRSKKKGEQA